MPKTIHQAFLDDFCATAAESLLKHVLLRAKGRTAIRRLSNFSSSKSDDQRRPPPVENASTLSSKLAKGKHPDPNGHKVMLPFGEKKAVERPNDDEDVLCFEEKNTVEGLKDDRVMLSLEKKKTVKGLIVSAMGASVTCDGDDRELSPKNAEGGARSIYAGGTDVERAVGVDAGMDDLYDSDDDDFNDSDSECEGDGGRLPPPALVVTPTTTPPPSGVPSSDALSAAAASPREQNEIAKKENASREKTSKKIAEKEEFASRETSTESTTEKAPGATTPTVPTTTTALKAEAAETAQGEVTDAASEGVHQLLPAPIASPSPTDATALAPSMPASTAVAAATPSIRYSPSIGVHQHNSDEGTTTKNYAEEKASDLSHEHEDDAAGGSPVQKGHDDSRRRVTGVIDMAGASGNAKGVGGGKGRKRVVPVSARR